MYTLRHARLHVRLLVSVALKDCALVNRVLRDKLVRLVLQGSLAQVVKNVLTTVRNVMKGFRARGDV